MREIADKQAVVVGILALQSYTLASTVVLPSARHSRLVVHAEIEVIVVDLDKLGVLGALLGLVVGISVVGIGLSRMNT